ncbi:MAG: AAA family ATPase [Clostridiales bacterium]|nr:AAA family ATPase [Clostridiales bacterium]
MHLWHNNAKSKKPVNSWLCGFGVILFHPNPKPKRADLAALKSRRYINAKSFAPRTRRKTIFGKAQKTAQKLAIANRKSGCGKTMTAISLAAGLARNGKRVLAIDADSQHPLTVSFSIAELDKLALTLASAMTHIVNGRDFDPTAGIVHHAEGVDVLPANSNLSALEISLAGIIGRETVLRQYIDKVKPLYDYIILASAPTLDLMTVNALAAADSVIIRVAPKFLDAIGLELLLKAAAQIRWQFNPALEFDGILLTMVDRWAHFTREVIASIENAWGGKIKIFVESVPRAAETSANGVSIFRHDPNGKVAATYSALVEGVLANG